MREERREEVKEEGNTIVQCAIYTLIKSKYCTAHVGGKVILAFPLGCAISWPTPHLVELYIYRYAHDALYASRANYASLVLARGSRIELLNDYELS